MTERHRPGVYSIAAHSGFADALVAGLIKHGHRNATALRDEGDLVELVRREAGPGDMVVCLGAGTISAWAHGLPKALGA